MTPSPAPLPPAGARCARPGKGIFVRAGQRGPATDQEAWLDGCMMFRDLAYASRMTGYVIHFGGGPFLTCGLG